jgi:transcriptional regulator of NAD metabolism
MTQIIHKNGLRYDEMIQTILAMMEFVKNNALVMKTFVAMTKIVKDIGTLVSGTYPVLQND